MSWLARGTAYSWLYGLDPSGPVVVYLMEGPVLGTPTHHNGVIWSCLVLSRKGWG